MPAFLLNHPVLQTSCLCTACPSFSTSSHRGGSEKSRITEMEAKSILERHPHFYGRTKWIDCQCSSGTLRLTGRLPSYYLKQLAQEALRDLDNVNRIENLIVVASPRGNIVPSNGVNAKQHMAHHGSNKPR